MNVTELIKKLSEYPAEMRVVTQGYEGGWHDITEFEEIGLCLFANDDKYFGEHEEAELMYPKREADEVALSLDGLNES